jgi:hypothetical protein
VRALRLTQLFAAFAFVDHLLHQVYVSTYETAPGVVGKGRAGAGQHGTSGPGVLAQHSKVRSAVLTWQLAMLA